VRKIILNGYKRINATLNGKWPDQRPVMLHNFMMAAKEADISMKEYRSNPKSAARAYIEAVEKYNLDGVLIDFDTATLAAAVGVPVDYPYEEPARTTGALLNSIEEIDDLEPIDISGDEHVQIWVETCRIVKSYFGDEIFVRGNCDQAPFSIASMIRSIECWMMDLYLNEEYVFKLLDYSSEISGQFIKLVACTGVDMVSNGDSPAGPALISPEMYRKFALPYEKKMADIAHELKLPYLLHICGNTDSILEDMIKTGADALELDYETDIIKVFNICKNDIAFFGNIDPSGVITFGKPELVEEKVKQLLSVYNDSPRFVMNSGCAIPAIAPPENIKQLVQITKNYKLNKCIQEVRN
jgi:MtaA/CmuA family methyltransferase